MREQEKLPKLPESVTNKQKDYEAWLKSPERNTLVSEWEKDPALIISYPKGSYCINSKSYDYPSGRMLLVKAEQVMDTCEYPWVEGNVRAVFEKLRENRIRNPKILVKGFGLGMDSTLILMEMAKLGEGELHIVELNKRLANLATIWRAKMRRNVLANTFNYLPFRDKENPIEIYIHQGDAYQFTAGLYKEIVSKEASIRKSEKALNDISDTLSTKLLERVGGELILQNFDDLKSDIMTSDMIKKNRGEIERSRFDAIFSDTYPMSDKEAGFNDLMDIEMTKALLTKNGIFTFFAYYPSSTGGLMGPQRDIIASNFNSYTVELVNVTPQEGYKYLFHPDGTPVNELPIVLCWNPRTNLEAYE